MNKEIKKILEEADAIVIGAGAGLSTAAGIEYSGERFEKSCPEFIEHYGFTDMYSAMFYPFDSIQEKWAYYSKHVYYNRYIAGATQLYQSILDIVKEKEYFVLTTNVDHQFYLAGFESDRVFHTQGDYGLFQCSKPCHNKLYPNEKVIKMMIEQQVDLKVPSELIPKCPKCGEEMSLNLRADDTFVQGSDWDLDHDRYEEFILRNQHKRIVFLELGVGMNTPGIIKYPFWQYTYQLDNSYYICLNKGEAMAPIEIKDKSLCINSNIAYELMS